ncbi:cytosolic factor, phosphatidylinositol/phosphatidylcholine transfer protein [Kappamyces sp. JEL0680]|nr:cytosolic factor, phosphatidylinositol/phosphatidylcholine transfer protein [Kappamyces sp. JEL0680]
MHENTNGRLGYLTPEQEAVLAQFKSELQAEGFYDSTKNDDHQLLRFLRARQFRLPQAKEMFIGYLKWRKEYGTDTILEDFDFPEYAKCRQIYPRIYHKTDKLGRPFYIERVGMVDVSKLWEATTSERMLRNHVYEYEKLLAYRFAACSAKAGRHFEQGTTVLDLSGVNLSSFSSIVGMVREVSSIGSNYYPEM